ncbi:hypothetical protein DEU56DRAFT_367205 [Suillus clintonianus]|uniref:uncharacterized protein n=1 Tax=Suillus clintonianus TaxID=1904413 RepID=UPI001B87DA12|nr:uncharacterized protein DEU56DRAFT_367205 [Suillus clintonianus]KAG2136052.1 hypothetical protein DEU56DRAFT_367205 [Suillus clintonianus]
MTSSGIPLDSANVLSTSLECMLYGFSALMFMGTVWALTYKCRIQDVNRPIAVVAILLFMISTAHIVVDIIRAEDGLVKYRDTFPGGPAGFFGDITQKSYAIKHALYLLQTLLADGVVIYRCYVVWQSVWVIIAPSMLWCGSVVTGVAANYFISQASSSEVIFAKPLGQWITAFVILTMTTNFLSSGLLAYRIWKIERDCSPIRATKSTMMPIVRVLMDAAVLYSVTLVTTLICFLCSNNGQLVLVDLAVPIMSIAFYMVLIRIAIARHTRSYPSTVPGGKTSEMEQGKLQPLQAHICQLTLKDGISSYGIGSEDRPSTCNAEPRSMEKAPCKM